jgi:uncharacterized membrane protein YfcA
MWFDAVLVIAGALAGFIAAVTGFGIGSLLTPVFALQVDTRIAVAAVSGPHLIGTALRFWLMRGGVDRRILWSFGLTSATGSLAGAMLYGIASTRWLTILFGVRLLFAAASEISGLARRMRFRGWWLAGVVIGTVIGRRALRRIPDVWFRRVLALMLAILGVAMLLRAR